MPCSDYRGGASDCTEVNERLQAATRAACDLLRALRFFCPEREHTLTLATLAWIRDHDIEDAHRATAEEERADRERVRQSGLQKLTPEERRALGIYS